MDFKNFVKNITDQIDLMIAILIGLLILFFIGHLISFISNSDNDDKRTEARNYMVYAILGLVIIVGFWGILYFFNGIFGVMSIPQLRT